MRTPASLLLAEMLTVMRTHAEKYGINEAHVLESIYLAMQNEGVEHDGDGRTYVQRSYLEWAEHISWMKERSVLRLLTKMRKDGLIERMNLGSSNWWTINSEHISDWGDFMSGGDFMSEGGDNLSEELSGCGVEVSGEGSDIMSGGDLKSDLYIHYTSSSNSLDRYPRSLGETGIIQETGIIPGTDIIHPINEVKREVDAPAKEKKVKKSKSKYYTYEQWDYDAALWAKIKEEGFIPARETRKALLLGSFLVAMKYQYGTVMAVAGTEFSGKLGKLSSNCLEYFTAIEGGNELRGFNVALDYVKWYVTQDVDEFLANKGRTVNLCFSTFAYRDAYQQATEAGKIKPKSKVRKGALALSDSAWIYAEDREADALLNPGERF